MIFQLFSLSHCNRISRVFWSGHLILSVLTLSFGRKPQPVTRWHVIFNISFQKMIVYVFQLLHRRITILLQLFSHILFKSQQLCWCNRQWMLLHISLSLRDVFSLSKLGANEIGLLIRKRKSNILSPFWEKKKETNIDSIASKI